MVGGDKKGKQEVLTKKKGWRGGGHFGGKRRWPRPMGSCVESPKALISNRKRGEKTNHQKWA